MAMASGTQITAIGERHRSLRAASRSPRSPRSSAFQGKKVSAFSPDGKAAKALVDAMLGPTGNLRAPTAVVGRTVLVGFNEDAYGSVFA